MREKDLERLRQLLVARRTTMEATIARLQQDLRSSADTSADPVDHAVSSYEKHELHQQADQSRRQLRLLDDALQRLDAGNYGECAACGNDIAIARLEAIPWARYCVTCQEIQEQGTMVKG